jgi:drug/metabolite transporter (DMT)-like permease
VAATAPAAPLALGALAAAVASSTTYRTRLELVTRAVDPRDASTWIFLLNVVLATVFLLPWVGLPPAAAVPSAIWTGAAAALANLAFLSAIKLVGATRMSIFDMLQRPLVIVAACLVLGEQLTVSQGIGVVAVLAGVQLAKVRRRTRDTAPAAVGAARVAAG